MTLKLIVHSLFLVLYYDNETLKYMNRLRINNNEYKYIENTEQDQ